MIAKIKKYGGAANLIRYLLKPTKQAQIVGSSIYSPTIDRAIGRELVIGDDDFQVTLARDIKTALATINSLNPRLGKNIMHLSIGFDPQDGELGNEFKGEIAKELMQRLGFADTYWVAVAHHRDDPEHRHVHQHDHMHIVAARVDCNGRTICDRWDYPKTEAIVRQLECEYALAPFMPFWERQQLSEMYWAIDTFEADLFDLLEEPPEPTQLKTLTRSR
jgi:Relaxase/Mobilisation nuclease domain